jgi:ABC-type transport system involved in multi-copper enzyme maturation permease subunit
MPPSAASWKDLLKRHGELLAGLAWAAGALSAFWLSRGMTRTPQVAVWGVLGITGALLLRRGWLKLFGPVLFYELIRLARRSRYALMRCLYAVFLFCILLLVYPHGADRYVSHSVGARGMAAFAESFFFAFVGVQYLAVCLLTPAYTAGAIAEERESKTLDFLLATDLQNREIVLSKQLSRLANMTLLILTGLPILAILQFLGGVDPGLLLEAFAATGLTLIGLGSLSILFSVYNRKPRNAIVLTYLTMAAYLAISGVLSLAHFAVPSVTSQELTWGDDPVTVQDLVDWFSVANPIVLLVKLARVSALADVVPDLLRNYALFYGAVTALCTGWAVLRLRAVALKQASGRVKRPPWATRRRQRPYEGDQPMVWKEVTLDPGLQFNWIGRSVIVLLILVSFIPPVWIGYEFFIHERPSSWRMDWEEFHLAISIWVRIVGTIVACLTLLGVAVRASSGISGERDRQTFDSLLTTPLDSDDMLFGKWLGGVVSVRWGWIWLLLIWGLGLVTGGLHVLALPLLVAAWGVYAGFLSYLGLFFSTVCRTTMRATITTLAVTLGLAGGHWLLWSCCLPFLGHGGRDLQHIVMFQAFGLTPPVTLAGLAFQGAEFERGGASEAVEIMVDCILGIGLWGVGAMLMWGMASQRLRQMTGRQLVRKRQLYQRETTPHAEHPAD